MALQKHKNEYEKLWHLSPIVSNLSWKILLFLLNTFTAQIGNLRLTLCLFIRVIFQFLLRQYKNTCRKVCLSEIRSGKKSIQVMGSQLSRNKSQVLQNRRSRIPKMSYYVKRILEGRKS